MQFCPKCNNRLEDSCDNQQLSRLICPQCGFKEIQTEEKEDPLPPEQQEREKSEPVIRVMDPAIKQKVPESTVDVVCPNCGKGKAEWAMVQTDRGDEPSTQFFRCTSCGHTWREE
jgi:DNA-directed RNA polymerase subunit M